MRADLENAVATELLSFGLVSNNDTNFRNVALWLARDPLYCSMRLDVVRHLHAAMASRTLLAATLQGQLVGLLSWHAITDEAAQMAIRGGRLPDASAMSAPGDAIFIGMTTASQPGAVKKILQTFCRLKRGKVIVFERHHSGGRATQRIGWVDRVGKLRGGAV